MEKKRDALADMRLPRRFAHRRCTEEGVAQRAGDDQPDELLIEKTDAVAAQRAARPEAAENGGDRIAAVFRL